MTLTRDDLAQHLGNRVRVTLLSDDPRDEFVLRFLPPPATVVLADVNTGQEKRVDLSAVASVEDARRPCDECPPDELYNNVFETDEERPRTLCAAHYRKWAYGQPAPIMSCGYCTTGAQAFYSPRTKRYACASCQGRGGGLTGLGVEARFLAVQNAACRAQPLDDLRHRWLHVRGSRYHCTLCDAKRFSEPPAGTLATTQRS